MSSVGALLVFWKARPEAGGLAIDVRDTAAGLALRGHDVRVASIKCVENELAAGDARDKAPHVTALHTRGPARVARRLGIAPGVGTLIRERPDSIVHVYSCLPVYLHFAAMLGAWRWRRRLVWTPMMHPHRRQSHYGAARIPMTAFDRLVPRLARFVDAVAAATDAEASFFRQLGCRLVEVIPPGVQPRPPVPAADARQFRARLGLDSSPLVLLVAARNEHRKGLGFALDAFAELQNTLPRAALLIVGSAWSRKGNPRPGVYTEGRLPDDELARAYCAADVVFVPSRYEAFSRVVIEAWQHARPVVATDGVALAPVVGRTGGRVVRFGDRRGAAAALREYLTNPSLRSRDGELGRRIVEENFLVPRILDQLEALYTYVCTSPPTTASQSALQP